LVFALIKEAFVAAAELPEDRVLDLEAKNQGVAASDDHKEGVAVFLEKRAAGYKGS
jgi:hypothetical protein